MSWLDLFWGWRRRLNRLQTLLGFYSLGISATILMMLVLPLVAPPAPGGGYIATSEVWAAILITQSLPLPFQASMFARRVHDLGVSADWLLAWVAYVAFLWMLIMIWPSLDGSAIELLLVLPAPASMLMLFVMLGQQQRNRFGDPPRAGWLP